MLLNIRQLMDDAKCYEVMRELRWPEGVCCPGCGSRAVNKRGFTTTKRIGNGIAARIVDDNSMI